MDHRLGKEGVYYHCGCYSEGHPSDFPTNCPTHGGGWKMKKTLEDGTIVTTSNAEKRDDED